jgi:hypothetical protein
LNGSFLASYGFTGARREFPNNVAVPRRKDHPGAIAVTCDDPLPGRSNAPSDAVAKEADDLARHLLALRILEVIVLTVHASRMTPDDEPTRRAHSGRDGAVQPVFARRRTRGSAQPVEVGASAGAANTRATNGNPRPKPVSQSVLL